MIYLAVLGRQPKISIAELEALFLNVRQISDNLALFSMDFNAKGLSRLGGSLKVAEKLEVSPLEFLQNLPEGKITLGVSDYSKNASKKTAMLEALKLKKILVRHARSVRVVENKDKTLSTATSLHNGLSGKNERKIELIKVNNDWFRVVFVQDIDAYAKRDQARPARDAKVGMLPPKLAQILINLCGNLPKNSVILDPFCGTGVVLQESLLMGYRAYGTDINERMVTYAIENLDWLLNRSSHRVSDSFRSDMFKLQMGDATLVHWNGPINAVACEGYLGKPMLKIPTDMELKVEKQECKTIIIGFLKNLAKQIKTDTPVVIAVPAWLRENRQYERLPILDEISSMGYNVSNKSREGLLYCREGQIVARDILILRKK